MADSKTSQDSTISAANVVDADYVPFIDATGPTDKRITMNELKDVILAEKRWKLVATAKYTSTPTNTYTLTMSDTSDMALGCPVRYVIGGTNYYGIIVTVTANTSITVAGASLSGDVTALYVGTQEMVLQIPFHVSSTYGDGAADLLDADLNRAYQWELANAYLVRALVKHKTDDTGAANPKVNVKIGGSAVSTNDSNAGFQLTTSWSAPATTVLVAMSTSNYAIVKGDAVEISCTLAGSNGDAADLSVMTIWVME